MAIHTTEQRAFIVRGLACHMAPEVILAGFAVAWPDTICTPEDIAQSARARLTPDWQQFYDTERAIFLAAPAADKKTRIALLSRMAMQAESRGAVVLAADLLEQIAKEQGGYFERGDAAANSNGGEPFTVTKITRTIVDPAKSAAEAVK